MSRYSFTKLAMSSWKDPVGCLAKDGISRAAYRTSTPLYIRWRKGEGFICYSSSSPTPHWFTLALTTGINSLVSRLYHLASWVAPEEAISCVEGTARESRSSGRSLNLFSRIRLSIWPELRWLFPGREKQWRPYHNSFQRQPRPTVMSEAEADSAAVVAAANGIPHQLVTSRQVKLRENEQNHKLVLVFQAGQTTTTHISSVGGIIRSGRDCGEYKRACCCVTLGNSYHARVLVQCTIFCIICNLNQYVDKMQNDYSPSSPEDQWQPRRITVRRNSWKMLQDTFCILSTILVTFEIQELWKQMQA